MITTQVNNRFYRNWIVDGYFDWNVHEQISKILEMPFVHPYVALMPDAHVGKGSCIGAVIPTKGAIMPASVGVDIGCGMLAVNLQRNFHEFSQGHFNEEMFQQISQLIPMGRSCHSGAALRYRTLIRSSWDLDLRDDFSKIQEIIKCPQQSYVDQLGTLGGGNHFIEWCSDQNDDVWMVIHSGSRGIGNKIGTYFTKLALEENRAHFINLPNSDLAYLVEGTENYNDYIFCMKWAQKFAWINRSVMADLILDHIQADEELRFLRNDKNSANKIHCNHNYMEIENHFGENVLLTRKGAIRARVGDFGIIPGSMGAKTYIVKGLGNPDSFCSASHGAGRIMSRSKAKEKFTLEDLQEQTSDVMCRKDSGVIDEIPNCYKPIELVMEAQKDLVEPINVLKQFMCWKG